MYKRYIYKNIIYFLNKFKHYYLYNLYYERYYIFLVTFCDAFVVNNNKFNIAGVNRYTKPNMVNMGVNMVYRPSELIKQVARGGLGDEWTYNDFVTNLQNHNVDAATLTNTNNMVVIDKNYALEVKPENLHLLQGVPQLTDNLINKLVENHINFDVFNMQQGKFLDNILVFQLVFFYAIGSFILNFVM